MVALAPSPPRVADHIRSSPPRKRKWFFRHWVLTSILAVLIVVGIVAHFYLHSFLIRYVNEKLDHLPGYHAHLDDIGVHLIRGAYSIERLKVLKDSGDVPVPFFSARDIDISVQWMQLFHRNLVAKVIFDTPQINLVTTAPGQVSPQAKSPQAAAQSQASGNKPGEQTTLKGDWQTQVKALIPFRLNYVRIIKGSIHFSDFHSDPPMDIYIRDLQLSAENLTNSIHLSSSLAATIAGTATLMKDGALQFIATANPYEKEPTFKYQLTLKHLSLPQLNSFFEKYAAVKVEDGTFDMFSEGAGLKGNVQGYMKPIIENLKTMKLKPQKKSVSEVFKGLGVEWVSRVLTNNPKERLGTRLEFKGRYDQLAANPWIAIASSLRNAFIHAMPATLDHTINVQDRNKTQIKKMNK